jgi:hypothetical protein
MAKKPGDRYQTPAELAGALASVGGVDCGLPGDEDLTIVQGRRTEAGDTLDSALASMATSDTEEAVDSPQRKRRKAMKRRLLRYGVAGGSLLVVGVAVILFLVLKERGGKKSPVKEEEQPIASTTRSEKTPAKVDDAWLKKVAAMPAEKQVEAVAAKLKELNPGFDGEVTPKIEGGVVTELQFLVDNVTDISPVRALAGLKSLLCYGSEDGKGKLADLSPLKDMKLKVLGCNNTSVADLSPLKDMELTILNCAFTPVADLSPLKGMPLTWLSCYGTPVADLSPLKGMPLTSLSCGGSKVADLSPLKDMKLSWLSCWNAAVSDLSPLKGMPLKEISCDFKAERDTEILRSIKTLEKINDQPAAEFWKEVEQKKSEKNP